MQFNHMFDEICRISAMKATSALSKLLKTPLKVDIKPVKVEPINQMKLSSHSNEMTVGMFVPIKGGSIKGGSFILSTQKSAFATCDVLLNREEGGTKEFTDVETSALKEVANIVMGNFLAPFARSLFTATIMHSPAFFENSTSDVIHKHMHSMLEKAIGRNNAVNISFDYEHAKIKGNINISFDSEKINFLLKDIMAISND